MRLNGRFLRTLLAGCAGAIIAFPAVGQATIDDATANATQLANRVSGSGVTVTGATIPAGNPSDAANMYGLFSNGIAGAGLAIDSGILLTTGTTTDALGPNNNDNASNGNNNTYSDVDVVAIDANARYNVALFEFNVTLDPLATGVELAYQFGSEEYPDYVGSQFNDVFAFFMQGPGITGTENIAQAPLGGRVRINNINIGTVGCANDGTPEDLTQSAFYVNNGHVTALPGTCQTNNALPGPFPVVTEYNGITDRLIAFRDGLTPGGTYQIKMAIADVADRQWDSGVFVEFVRAYYEKDYGDAPNAGGYGNPRHDVSTTLTLGPSVTTESGGYNSPTASGDVDNAIGAMPPFTAGSTATVPVAVSGGTGFLQAWIDWNQDGDFGDAGEQIATNAVDGGAGDTDGSTNGTIELSVSVPASALSGDTFARFRISSTAGLNESDDARDGEVEDYVATISGGVVPGPPTCPAPLVLVSSTGNADTVITTASFSNNALGVPEAAGLSANTGNSARLLATTPTLTLDMTDLVPENGTVDLTIARDTTDGLMTIAMSDDNVSYTTVTAFNTGPNDDLKTISAQVPAGGARYIRFVSTSGSTWVAGLAYDQICRTAPTLLAVKTTAVFDADGPGVGPDPYALPNSDVIYTITVTNTGSGATDPNSVVLIDRLPAEIEFFNGDIDMGGLDVYAGTDPVGFEETDTALTWTYTNDVRFALNTDPVPADFDDCAFIAPDATYRADISHICFNPKGTLPGAGATDPTFSLSFRGRIK